MMTADIVQSLHLQVASRLAPRDTNDAVMRARPSGSQPVNLVHAVLPMTGKIRCQRPIPFEAAQAPFLLRGERLGTGLIGKRNFDVEEYPAPLSERPVFVDSHT
jgi:hypothetical protein